MSDSRRPYRVDKDTRGEFWAIWTARDETPGSRNNYVITDGIQHESEARSLCLALNGREETLSAVNAAVIILERQAMNITPSVMAIREAISILRGVA